LALYIFGTPIARAVTLELLQALYVIMGGTAGSLSLGLGILAGMFFFAIRPSPRLAHVLTFVFMMGAGTLICLAMILESI